MACCERVGVLAKLSMMKVATSVLRKREVLIGLVNGLGFVICTSTVSGSKA